MTTKTDSKAGSETRNCYLYSRVSTGGQKHGSGLVRQSERGKAICQEQGWNLVDDDLADIGSAFTGENVLAGNLGKFIQAAKEKRLLPNPVLCLEQWDRFSRTDLDSSFERARDLLKCGVDIHIGLQGGKTFTKADLNDIPSRIAMELSMQQAWEYSNNLSKRVNAAFSRKYDAAMEGKAVQLGNWQPAWVDFIGPKKGIGSFRLNAIANVVKGICHDYLSGMSMLAIAAKLNSANVPCIGRKSKQGKQWSQGQVGYILRSPSLVGTITIAGKTFANYYPSILSKAEWDRLQSKLDQNLLKRSGKRQGEWISNLLPNRVRCSQCGGTVSTHNSKCGNVKQRYYKCNNARVGKCSIRHMLRTDLIEESLFLEFFAKQPKQLIGNANDYQDKVARIESELRDIEQQASIATEALSISDFAPLKKRFAALQTRKNALLKERETLTRLQVSSTDTPRAFGDIRKALKIIDKDARSFNEIARIVIASLKDADIRNKLVAVLPSLLSVVEVDLNKGAYRVQRKDGTWTDFTTVLA
jgi:DNA invertase Pin-like site-specific DNA recombinase